MTTKPTVRRFRLSRDPAAARTPPVPAEPATVPEAAAASPATAAQAPVPPRQRPVAPPEQPLVLPETDMLSAPPEDGEAAELQAIRAEGLTARQLRMARRVAQAHGIAAANDAEAVMLLRRKGIDPFQRTSVVELVRAENSRGAPDTGPVHLPQTVRPDRNLPGAPMDDARRAAEIVKMQRDIARRRRRKLALLFARLAFFVFLPTFIAGWYYYRIATPFYATKTEFVIQQAQPAGGSSGLGSLFTGTQFATSQDSITVQSYLQSRDAMLRLDSDLGFKAHYSQGRIDPVQRLPEDATNEQAYKLFQRNVRIGFDPTEGLVKMEVVAADPETSQKFAEALVGYAEEQVDQLTKRLRDDQMAGAEESYQKAEANVQAAQAKVLALQEQLGVLDPRSEQASVMSQISRFEIELQEKRLQLQALLDNPEPNQARVSGTQGDIARLDTLIAELRAQLTEDSQSGASLATVSGQLQLAESELLNRQQLLTMALQQVETARIEANRQVRYLSVGVAPVAPDEATYPRAFENTLVAFLIFAGIYLMLSLTVAILREQAA